MKIVSSKPKIHPPARPGWHHAVEHQVSGKQHFTVRPEARDTRTVA